MVIKSVEIENFRGYSDCIRIDFDKLTAFVGKNDVGKSTILEALDIFFNEGKGAVKLDKSDVNIERARNGDKETKISICFNEIPERILLDTTVETSLENEYMLNSEGNLEIIKRYNNASSPKVYIKANHPTNENCKDLLTKKNSELKKIVDSNSIECSNQNINSVLRKSIWDYYSDDLQLEEMEIDASKEDAKIIWEKLNDYMPVYSLFQVDRKNSDGDDEVQDPLREAVKQILAKQELQDKLKEVAVEVNRTLKEVADRTLEKLSEMDPNIANDLTPVIPEVSSLKWQDVFKNVSIASDNDIPINKRGSGVKRLVLLNFFRAEVERKADEDNKTGIIYAIEEPETSQHTNNQQLLIDALKDMITDSNTQVILTTHSPNIVKKLNFSNLRMITEQDDGKKIVREPIPAHLKYPSLNEVNYIAFEEVSEEYHDELYSYIEFKGWLGDYKQGKTTMLYKKLETNGNLKDVHYILSEYIRHQIHHPENTHNVKYTKDKLKESIDLMRDYINNKENRTIV